MLGELLGNFINKEDITRETIQNALVNIATELQCAHKDFFVMIKPKNLELDFGFYIYRITNEGPKLIREISLKEILGETTNNEK